jgi:hypothetical protein
MQTINPASQKQISFIESLAAERAQLVNVRNLTSRDASALITQLLAMPKKVLPPSKQSVTEIGIYRSADGSVYKVQESKQSGNLYAQKLTPIGGDRLNETGATVHWTFVYAPGAIKSLTPADRLTLEQAKAFGIKYGVCIVCGRLLSDAKSVANGIGPVCGKRV